MRKWALRVFFSLSFPFLLLQAQGSGALRVSPTALQFTGISNGGATPAQTLSVINDTPFQVNITGQWSGSFFSDFGDTGSLQATLNQTGNTFTGTFVTPFRSGDLTGTINGTSAVFGSGAGSDFSLSFLATIGQNSIAGTYIVFAGGSVDDQGSFSITRLGTVPPGTTISWTQQASVLTGPSGWLVSQPASGSSTSGARQFSTIDVSALMAGLSPGQYSGQITVSSSGAVNSPVVAPVLLSVLPPGTSVAPQVRPAGLVFVAAVNTPPRQAVRISTASAGTIQVGITTTTQDNRHWLALNQSTVTLQNNSPVDLNLSVAPAGLSAGVYQGQVRLTFSDGSPTQTVSVLLIVPYGGLLTPAARVGAGGPCNATSLLAVDRVLGANFSSLISWPTNLEALVVDDCGIEANNATVVASFSNGDAPLALARVGNGTYTASWRPINVAASVTVTVTATFPPLKQAQVVLGGKVNDNPNVPVIFAGGVVGGANFSGATLAPGGIVSVFGKNLAQTGAAASLPLPTELGGVKLTTAGRDLPLFFSSTGQVNAQLPTELASGTKVALVARTKIGGNGNPVLAVPEVINVGAAAPGIFSASQDGKGQGVIFDPANRLVDGKQTAAAAGDVVVIYSTGLGATTPAVASGVASPGSPAAPTTQKPEVRIGGQSAAVQFAGLTPGFVGLYQINVVVPPGVTPGPAVPVIVTSAGVASNTVTMAVK